MLGPVYHLIRAKFEFDGNNRGVPWYKQALPLASIENDHAKIMWDIPMHLDKRPSNNAKGGLTSRAIGLGLEGPPSARVPMGPFCAGRKILQMGNF